MFKIIYQTNYLFLIYNFLLNELLRFSFTYIFLYIDMCESIYSNEIYKSNIIYEMQGKKLYSD